MMRFIISIEKASGFNWYSLWVETDFMYFVIMFNKRTGNIPWRGPMVESSAKSEIKNMNLVISHIFREGNNMTNKLASHASFQIQNL